MTARAAVIAALSTQVGPGLPLEGVDVIGYARSIDPPAVNTVLVRLDDVVPSPDNPQAENLHHYSLILLTPLTEPGAADDELEAFLEDVLFAVAKAGNLTWSKATRATYQGTNYPAFEVALDVPFLKE